MEIRLNFTNIFCLVFFSILLFYGNGFAQNRVSTQIQGNLKCIFSNGVPNHQIGKFPTRGNPNAFRPQNLRYCFSLHPVKNLSTTTRARVVGVTLTGIPIRPSTAGWYDPSSPRGYSMKRNSDWNLEALTPNKKIFGLDDTNAHVDKRGLYHYHGFNKYLLRKNSSLIGYAADGFEIHYLKEKTSSWQLRKGLRKTPPYGTFDGSFKQDYQYVEASGGLDQCNGGLLNQKFVYFATKEFPFFPRCHWGNVTRDFLRP